MNRRTIPFLFFLCCMLPLPLHAQWENPVGRIIVSRGSATADHPDGTSRVLRRRSEVYAGDRISTGPNGFVQIRMADNALYALKNESTLSIHTYSYDGKGGNPDMVALELHEGGVRAIDGLIGKAADDEYALVTPDVDVFLAGGSESTTYECVVQDDCTWCGVYDGSLTLSNLVGTLEIDNAGDSGYARADSRLEEIESLNITPDAMGKFVFPLAGNTD